MRQTDIFPLIVGAIAMLSGGAPAQSANSNILVIWGADIGITNIRFNNRGHTFGVWREPFTKLRGPLLFNLRRDPFERAQGNANSYHDWVLDRGFIFYSARAVAQQFMETMKEYPPSQAPGSFTIDAAQKRIGEMSKGKI